MAIYLDNSATTRICEEALETYLNVSRTQWGNPSSRHGLGKEAEDLINQTRGLINQSLGSRDGTVIFTAGGTEANNLAIFGRAYAKPRYRKGGKILTTQGEHSSVTQPLTALMNEGFRVVAIPTKGGELDWEVLEKELTPDVVLVTMMLVNNETGAIYDLGTVSRLMRANCPDGVLHVDATQAYLKIPFTIKSLGCDLVTISSHKVEGPKGVGALWVSPAVVKNRGLAPRELGGGQEGGYRSGTENVPGIAAFGAAIRKETGDRDTRIRQNTALSERLITGIATREGLSEVRVNLPPHRAPHIVSITLPKIKSETMLHFLSSYGIYVSSGSACSSNSTHKSSALVAFGRSEDEADYSIRVSLSHRNEMGDIDALIEALKIGLEKLSRVR